MSKTILLNHSNWHFTKENPGIPAAVMGETCLLYTSPDAPNNGASSFVPVQCSSFAEYGS